MPIPASTCIGNARKYWHDRLHSGQATAQIVLAHWAHPEVPATSPQGSASLSDDFGFDCWTRLRNPIYNSPRNHPSIQGRLTQAMIRFGILSVDEKTFLDEIIAAPENHEPRLVYADWLEDNGDPRGEFIRLQIERDVCQQDPTRSIERGTREEKLLEAYREQWSAPLLKLGIEKTAVGFRWGFIDAVGVSCRTAVSHMGAIRSFCPLLRRLYLHSVTDWIDQLSGSPHLNGLIQIGFRGLLTPENVQHFFFDTPRLETLKAIDFGDTRIGDSGLAILLTAPQLRDIMALDLNDCNLTWRAVRQVLNWRLASQLEWLNLRHNPISDRGGKLLTRTRKLTSVKHLNLVRTQLETGLIAQLNARWGDVLHS